MSHNSLSVIQTFHSWQLKREVRKIKIVVLNRYVTTCVTPCITTIDVLQLTFSCSKMEQLAITKRNHEI